MADALQTNSTGSLPKPSWFDGLDASAIESGNRIDRLMTLEIRPLSGGLPPGIVVPMYEICRAHQGGPLSMAAASALIQRVRPGDTVLIATGAGVAPTLPQGETDGPVGAAALALALVRGLGAKAVLVTEDAHRGPVDATVECANAKLLAPAALKREQFHSVEVESFPLGMVGGQVLAAEIMARYLPSAIVFVERDGPNVEGQFHGVRGDCRDPEAVGYVYLLADYARAAGVLTVGIGDGGNEVGFGAMRAQILDILPQRGRSLHGHSSGVVTVVATDVTVSASVSNWGASAVVAALAVLLGDEAILHDPDTERELIEAAVAAGACDGATSKHSLLVDGIGCAGHMAFVELLRTVARASIRSMQVRTAEDY